MQVIATTDRAAVGELITMPKYVDVIIARGKGLIERISRDAKVAGNQAIWTVFVTSISTIRRIGEKAISVAFNAKTQRYGTCNTMETLLVHQAVAADILP